MPWWGPVLAPVGIAVLMILWGTLVTQFERGGTPICSNPRAWTTSLTGVALALYLFMEDAIWALPGGAPALRELLPTRFNWPMFSAALVLMSVPIAQVCGQLRVGRPTPLARAALDLNNS